MGYIPINLETLLLARTYLYRAEVRYLDLHGTRLKGEYRSRRCNHYVRNRRSVAVHTEPQPGGTVYSDIIRPTEDLNRVTNPPSTILDEPTRLPSQKEDHMNGGPVPIIGFIQLLK